MINSVSKADLQLAAADESAAPQELEFLKFKSMMKNRQARIALDRLDQWSRDIVRQREADHDLVIRWDRTGGPIRKQFFNS